MPPHCCIDQLNIATEHSNLTAPCWNITISIFFSPQRSQAEAPRNLHYARTLPARARLGPKT